MNHKIIRLKTKSIGKMNGSLQAARHAEIVINKDGQVIKDRHGDAPRDATPEELSAAVHVG